MSHHPAHALAGLTREVYLAAGALEERLQGFDAALLGKAVRIALGQPQVDLGGKLIDDAGAQRG